MNNEKWFYVYWHNQGEVYSCTKLKAENKKDALKSFEFHTGQDTSINVIEVHNHELSHWGSEVF